MWTGRGPEMRTSVKLCFGTLPLWPRCARARNGPSAAWPILAAQKCQLQRSCVSESIVPIKGGSQKRQLR